MTEVKKKKYPISPTMRWISQEPGQEGRLTGEGFRLMKAITELVEAVTIEDGEVKTEMLEAGIIRVSTLFADEVVITSKVKPNAISELTALLQVGSTGPGGTILSGVVPISSVNNTGLLLTFTGFMDRPTSGSNNFGYWNLNLYRNGSLIQNTPALFYDDNFSYQPVASFIDPTPGANPTYTLGSTLLGGPGAFNIMGGVLNVGLLKR